MKSSARESTRRPHDHGPQPGRIIEPDQRLPTVGELWRAGLLSAREYGEALEMGRRYAAGLRDPGRPDTLTLTHVRRDPTFRVLSRRLALGAARGACTSSRARRRQPHVQGPRHRRSGATSSTSSSDPGDDPDPEPCRAPAWLRCPGCGGPLVEKGNDAHCGGCGPGGCTYWGMAR